MHFAKHWPDLQADGHVGGRELQLLSAILLQICTADFRDLIPSLHPQALVLLVPDKRQTCRHAGVPWCMPGAGCTAARNYTCVTDAAAPLSLALKAECLGCSAPKKREAWMRRANAQKNNVSFQMGVEKGEGVQTCFFFVSACKFPTQYA